MKQSNLSQELSKIRDEAGAACKRQLHPSNSPLVMAQSGSKGTFYILWLLIRNKLNLMKPNYSYFGLIYFQRLNKIIIVERGFDNRR